MVHVECTQKTDELQRSNILILYFHLNYTSAAFIIIYLYYIILSLIVRLFPLQHFYCNGLFMHVVYQQLFRVICGMQYRRLSCRGQCRINLVTTSSVDVSLINQCSSVKVGGTIGNLSTEVRFKLRTFQRHELKLKTDRFSSDTAHRAQEIRRRFINIASN